MAERTERVGANKQMGGTAGGAGPRGWRRGEGCQPRDERRGRKLAWVGKAGTEVGGGGEAAATQLGGRAERREMREAMRGAKARVPTSVMSAERRRERVETASPRVKIVGC